MSDSHRCKLYEKGVGPVKWMRTVFRFVESQCRIYKQLNLDQAIERDLIAAFIGTALEGSEFEPKVAQRIMHNNELVDILRSFDDWASMKKAIHRMILTADRMVTLRQDFHELSFVKDVDTLVAAIQDYMDLFDVGADRLAEFTRDKLCSVFSAHIVKNVQNALGPGEPSIFDCQDVERIITLFRQEVERAKMHGEPITARQQAKSQHKSDPKVASASAASSSNYNEEKAVSVAANTTSTNRSGKAKTQIEGERSNAGRSKEDFLQKNRERAVKFISGLTTELATERSRLGVCLACGIKGHQWLDCRNAVPKKD
jgi:hypothetical protein